MKIAIHKNTGFASRWIEYCEQNGINYKVVNCYSTSIIHDLKDCSALMWHFHHANPLDSLFAKQLLYAIESSGKKVFPDFNTCWHFDDKLGQKYLLEAIGAPLVPSYVFYSKSEALKWIKECELPVVFKLRTGASSENVRLIRTRHAGISIISKAFGRGFSAFNRWHYLKERVRRYLEGLDNFSGVLKGLARTVIPTIQAKMLPRQKGYIYFQEFIPENDFDIRVIVILDKAFAIKRMVRRNDFRASGSGMILYDRDLFEEKTLNLSFYLAKELKAQCLAFDFIYRDGNPLLTEISYGFLPKVYDLCPGFWDKELNWHPGSFNPYGWMVEMVL